MADILPNGTMQGYFNICKDCGKEIEVNEQGTPISHKCDSKKILDVDISYTIGKFQVLLNETGDLRVIVHTNNEKMKIQPKSDNSIILQACR